MTIGSSVTSELSEKTARQPFFRWLRLVQILSLVAVFAGGYLYAKILKRFQPNQVVALEGRQPTITGLQSQATYQSQNAVQQKTTQANPQKFAQNSMTPQSSNQSNTRFATAVADVDKQPPISTNPPQSLLHPTVTNQANGFLNEARGNSPSNSLPTKTLGSTVATPPALTATAPTYGTPANAAYAAPTYAAQTTALPNFTPAQSIGTTYSQPPNSNGVWVNSAYSTQGVGPVIPILQQSPRTQADEFTTPEEQAIEASLAELAGKIHQAKKDDKPEFIEKLKAQIAEHFKLRHAVHAKEIEEMEKELEQAKSLHTKRNEKQEEIIERRLRHLLNELDDLDWNRGLKGSGSQPGYYGTHISS